MKKWPEEDDQSPFENLVEPLKRVLLFGYDMTRKNKDKDCPYDGYDIATEEIAVSGSLKERFLAKFLKDSKDHGRDLLDEVLGAAFQLGVEQGRRALRQKIKPDVRILDSRVCMIKDEKDRAWALKAVEWVRDGLLGIDAYYKKHASSLPDLTNGDKIKIRKKILTLMTRKRKK